MGYVPPLPPGAREKALTWRDRMTVVLIVAAILAVALPIALGLALLAYMVAF